MNEQQRLNAELEELRTEGRASIGDKIKAGWPFGGKADRLTPEQLRALELQSYAAHCHQVEAALLAMVPPEHRLSGGQGPESARVFVKGAADLLKDQKRRAATWQQALAISAQLFVKRGWISEAQRAGLSLTPPEVPEVVAQRQADQDARDQLQAEFDATLAAVVARARSSSSDDKITPGSAHAQALALWNRAAKPKTEKAIKSWKAAVKSAGLL